VHDPHHAGDPQDAAGSVSDLLARWRTLFPAGDADSVGLDLLRRWQEPQRHYHTLTHLRALLDLLPDAPRSLQLAIWFHDAVYDPRASVNEEASSELARAALASLGMEPDEIAEVVRLILLTKKHTTVADDDLGRLLLDADLSILGAADSDYDAYAAAIRREYAWVEEGAYRQGRAGVLRQFLARDHIYQTERFRHSHEQQARRNLEREVASLDQR
jgi:predicted metal-dependent HD superfamily phosphohydrolase